jgi:FkbM family methyltransferase
MIKKIFKGFVIVASFFIFDKTKKATFMEKYFSFIDVLAHIKDIYKRTAEIEEGISGINKRLSDLEHTSNLVFEFTKIPVFAQRKQLFNERFKKQLEITDDEHRNNISELYKSLDTSAALHLSEIVNRLNKISSNYLASTYSEIYNEHEKEAFLAYEKFERSIKSVDSYFQYLDYKLPINYFDPSAFPHFHGIAHLKTADRIKEKAIIDVGCLFGESILIFRKHFPDSQIFSFEPSGYNYNLALETLRLNEIKEKVKIENLALGNIQGITKLNGWTIDKDAQNGEDVRVDTLDNYVAANNIQVGLIKVDVEGGEMDFLQGAINTIKRQKPILMLSIYHSYDDFYKIKPFVDSLDLGYKFDFYQSIDKYAISEILLFCECY